MTPRIQVSDVTLAPGHSTRVYEEALLPHAAKGLEPFTNRTSGELTLAEVRECYGTGSAAPTKKGRGLRHVPKGRTCLHFTGDEKPASPSKTSAQAQYTCTLAMSFT